MAKGKKYRIIDVSLKEFLADAEIKGKSTFDKRFTRFLEIYPLNDYDKNYFKKDPQNELSEYEFKWEWYQLFKALFISTGDHTFFQRNRQPENVTANDFKNYYESLLNQVEHLPDYLRKVVISHPTYQNTLKEKEVLPDLATKIAEFVCAMELITQQERPDIMIAIYKQLDEWIYQAFMNNERIKLVEQRNQEINKDLLSKGISKQNHNNQKEKEELKNQLLQEEEFKWQYKKKAELDQYLAFLLKDALNQSQKQLMSDEELAKLANLFGSDNDRSQPNAELFRVVYDSYLERSIGLSGAHVDHIETIIKAIKKYNYKKQTSVEKINRFYDEQKKMTQFEYEQQFLDAKEKRKEQLRHMIQACQDELKELEETNDFLKEGTKIEELLHEGYLEFYKQVQRQSEKYQKATQIFVGQLVSPSFDVNQ